MSRKLDYDIDLKLATESVVELQLFQLRLDYKSAIRVLRFVLFIEVLVVIFRRIELRHWGDFRNDRVLEICLGSDL